MLHQTAKTGRFIGPVLKKLALKMVLYAHQLRIVGVAQTGKNLGRWPDL